MIAALPAILAVAQADSEASAREQLLATPPALVVIDPSLRSGNGLSVIAHLKSVQPATTVMVLTNMVFPEYQAKCMELGADYFFDKSKETAAFGMQLGKLCASAPWAHRV